MSDWKLDTISQEQIDHVSRLADMFTLKKSVLSDTIAIDEFLSLVEIDKEISHSFEKLFVTAYLKTVLDTSDVTAKTMLAKIQYLGADLENKTRFFSHWFTKLPEEKANELIAASTDPYVWKQTFAKRKHLLSEAEEHIISLKDISGKQALHQLYDTITNSFSFTIEGTTYSLEQLRMLFLQEDRKLRRKAAQLLKEKFTEHSPWLQDLYITLARDYYSEYITLRKFESPLSVRTESEDISISVVENLFEVAKKNTAVFHEFFELKAKLLSLEKLESYDVLAPVASLGTYDEQKAYGLIDTIFDKIDEKDTIKKLFDDNRVDSTIAPKKRGGAFCYPVSNQLPYVCLQFKNHLEDVYTMAHELGHALHFTYTYEKGVYSHMPAIGICESVSTFMEELLTDELLGSADEQTKKALLTKSLIDIFSTVQRQIYISYFEKQAHDAIQKEDTDLDTLWGSLQKEQFGEAVNLDEKNISWMYIPHIYQSPFYCYNYGVGLIIALLMFDQFKNDKEAFLPRFRKYLALGKTCSIEDAVSVLGIDLTDANDISVVYRIAQERLSYLKDLVNNT